MTSVNFIATLKTLSPNPITLLGSGGLCKPSTRESGSGIQFYNTTQAKLFSRVKKDLGRVPASNN